MSGSAGNSQVGLRLIVPALTLVFPALLLAASLLSVPAAAPPVVVDPGLLVAATPPDDLAIVMDAPAAEEPLPPVGGLVAEAALEPAPMLATAIPTPRATPVSAPSWIGPQTFTFVALGVDQRNEKEIPRTDTIMIGRVDLREPRVSLVSIPRDLLVDIPGYGKDRINTAYVYGEQFKEPGGGIGLLQRTIEKSFGIRVDHFGLVDFQCFRTAVDAVGGVTINVPRLVVDPSYPTEDYGTKLVRFEPGLQRMDGERALEYARTRYADSDFHRIQRQQLIIAAMRDQLLQLRTLPSLPTVLGGCRNMRSDLGWRDYVTLTASLQSLNGSKISFAAIDEQMTTNAILASGANVLIPRWGPIRELLAASFGPGTMPPAARTGALSSPTPALPVPSPSPYLAPLPLDASIAGPFTSDVLPGDVQLPIVPEAPSVRRT